MKHLLLLSLVFGLCSMSLTYGQNRLYTLTGKVNKKDQTALEFGNAIALNGKDSSIHRGVPFENGEFYLPGISKDSILLKITAIGYKDVFISFFHLGNDSVYRLPDLSVEENNTLNEITVTAKTPLFQMDGEKMKVNVEGTSLNSVGTALDVLRRSPSVMVSSTDDVSVFGKGSAIIYLDGLLISSIDILKSLPSSDIKSIEIIRNPSAKYDAAGRAVINIITIRNNLQGYNGNVIQNVLYGKYLFTYTGFRLNYTKGKWSSYLGYGNNMGEQWNSDEYKRSYKTNDTSNMEMNNSIYETTNFKKTHYYRTGINYRIDTNSVLSIQYSGFYNAQNTESKNQNSILLNNFEDYTLKTITNGKPIRSNNSINSNYSKKLDTLGSELFVAAQFGNFIAKTSSQISQQTNLAGNINDEQKRNSNNNNIKIVSAQVDFTKAFTKHWKLESGFKNSYIAKTSDIQFENYSSTAGWVSDPLYLNGFEFNENIAALYSELRYQKKKLNTRIGARSELTKSNGFSKRLNQKIIDRQYINYFPSAFIGYDFTKDLTTAITLSSRINRPTFQDLDPFINYVDSLTSFRGNPYLLPEYTNSIEASLIYMKEANISFGYNRTNGAMRLMIEKLSDTTDAFTAITKNIKKSESYSFGVTIPYELEWWTTSNYFGYFLNNYSYELNGVLIQNLKPTFSIYLYDEFRFKKLFSLEITYEYTSKAVDGMFISKPFSMLNATLKKTFFNDKLTCRFTASDMLSSYIMAGESNIPVYHLNYYSRVNTHYYQLSLNYKFGKLKNANYKNRSVSEDEYQRIKMGK